MALRAKYEADFSDFYAAVEKAESSLGSWETAGGAVESQMNAIAGSLEGAPIIQQTDAMASAVEQLGSVSSQTTATLEKTAATVSHTTATVQQLPPELQTLTSTTQTTTSTIGQFDAGLSAADKVLGQFGIHIGPQIKALKELEAQAGTTSSALGLLTRGLLLKEAAETGWKIGRFVADLAGTDELIGNATAKLLGFDVAAQQAGAGADVLNRATTLAGRTITDFAEAQQIIIASNKAMSESLNTSASHLERWGKEIADVRAAGHIPAIDAALKSKTMTLQQISQHYKISAEALEYYNRKLGENNKAEQEAADRAKERFGVLARAHQEIAMSGETWRRTLETIGPAQAKYVTGLIAMDAPLQAIATSTGLTIYQVRALDQAWNESLATMARTEPALGTLDAWMKSLPPALKKAGESQMFFDKQLIESLGSITATTTELEKMEGQIRSVTEAQAAQTAAVSKNAPGAVGVTLGGGGGIQLNTDLQSAVGQYNQRYGLGGSSQPDFLAWALQSGLATKTPAPNVNITMNGVLSANDPQTKAQLRSVVSEALMDGMRGSRLMGTA